MASDITLNALKNRISELKCRRWQFILDFIFGRLIRENTYTC